MPKKRKTPSLNDKSKRKRKLLEVLNDGSYYDYEIFIDGEGTIRKVKEEDLFPLD